MYIGMFLVVKGHVYSVFLWGLIDNKCSVNVCQITNPYRPINTIKIHPDLVTVYKKFIVKKSLHEYFLFLLDPNLRKSNAQS